MNNYTGHTTWLEMKMSVDVQIGKLLKGKETETCMNSAQIFFRVNRRHCEVTSHK